jgi:hypothetical protein
MDPDEKYTMNEEARIINNHLPPFYIPQPGECPQCGSMNTFKTFDGKIICRENWHVNNL